MEQDSRSSESRERAVSSEPGSTRPNPFVDDSENPIKRRRTSLNGSLDASRSRSAETLPSQEEETSDSIMKVDAPDNAPPSTPPRSEPPATEPHSSKVTINLRNTDNMESTVASPTYPTAPFLQNDTIKVSVEESEVEMGQSPPGPDPGFLMSNANSPQAPTIIAIDDDDEDDGLDFANTKSPVSLVGGGGRIDINMLMAELPYHSVEETYCETVYRLVQYFQSQPGQIDEVLAGIKMWLDRYLDCAHGYESYSTVLGSAWENRNFWAILPDLFWSVYQRRHFLTRTREVRELAGQFFVQLVKLSSHFAVLDSVTVQRVVTDEEVRDLPLISHTYLHTLGNMTRKDESEIYNGYPTETIPDTTELLHIYLQETPAGPMSKLCRLVEMLTRLLNRFPRRVMDSLVGFCSIAESITRDSVQRMYHSGSSHGLPEQYRNNFDLGLQLFKRVAGALTEVLDKALTQLSGDTACSVIRSLTQILIYSLQGQDEAAVQMVEELRTKHPEYPKRHTADIIANEWRLTMLSRLIRCTQMQLRVAAVGIMSNELVAHWKRYHNSGEDGQFLEYMRHLSSFLTNTGLVDYILGPTCHPEITVESSNIIGFLVVTNTYTPVQTDLFWRTVTSTQDPRVAEVLSRMMTKTVNLMQPEHLGYLCEKFHSLPVVDFSLHMRELCNELIRCLHGKPVPLGKSLEFSPHRLCLRLLQESSAYSPQGSMAYPEIWQFAVAKMKDLLQYNGNISVEMRQDILSSCVKDIASKSRTTSASLIALNMVIRPTLNRDLAGLITDHNFTRLLVDELEATIAAARDVGYTPVYASQVGTARRDLIGLIIMNHGDTIDAQYGRRLWDILVGDGAACHEDRKAAWQNLNLAVKRVGFNNPFLRTCLRDYLKELPPSCYCEGALEFVRAALLPLLADAAEGLLDEEDRAETGAIEILWRMILTAPTQSIETQAINTLVNDVYVDNNSINNFPLHRARKVHFSVVNRCLQQLAAAAQMLNTYSDGTASGDDESMVIVASDDQQREQELKFTRSLAVLRALLGTLQSRSHFTAPDLRSLMLQSPSVMEGESAELKFQSFDGDKQTEVKPLAIGRKNTAAALLASLRDVTGFDNYRIFYRGIPLSPTEDQICKSLEDLNIHDGLLLVKREVHVASSPVKVKPGASPLEIEILSHFKDLWEYLSMDERLAREIYQFLVRLPAEQSILEAFEDASTSHRNIFPIGQPFKSLYAVHALREYLSTWRLKNQVMQVSTQDAESQQKTALDQQEALSKAMSLLIDAICDPEVIGQGSSENLQVLLCYNLVDNFLQQLKDSNDKTSVAQLLSPALLDRLLEILAHAVTTSSPHSLDLISRSFEAMLECCAKSNEFWTTFCQRPALKNVIQHLILAEERPFVRKTVVKLINLQIHGPPGVMSLGFAELLWPILFEILPRAVLEPNNCEEFFSLLNNIVKQLVDASSPTMDLPVCLEQCGKLVLAHASTEDVSRPDRVDFILQGLVSILHHGIKTLFSRNEPVCFPSAFMRDLFNKHLFPPYDRNGALVPQALLSSPARGMLCEIILRFARVDQGQYVDLLRDLYRLTAPNRGDVRMELPQMFDRTKAVRAPCGYTGLRNLSNTCYLNSLLTQLFMNVGFRRFILETPVPDSETHQLLYETRLLFASLQDSVRRFIDPAQCVSQIMTYDEAPIDIHSQMDVDEFYNLLFDRWESQLSTDNAKKALRSIYGGQLVQQVKSKECEHISERIEPFSAIQCDIKGKGNLEESLQAYVDGEIMEGDNKYKCETCDRHVDAVKRACLKDIPDNLIFHLKRFDFNLRTLQRSKINDYFRFPNKIDMQPYTVEHLSDPTCTTEPDIFELVGVLVHSGTAESGHYYSFIRERPSTSNVESWIEFNDDVVNAWDHTQNLEAACFGGPDYRHPLDNGAVYDKVYSAYMLFYQRSSSLKQEQELLKQYGKPSPLKFHLPLDLEEQVRDENWALVMRHALYDPTHVPFVHNMVKHAWDTEDYRDDHKVENLAMKVALGHFDQVVTRAKDIPEFNGFHQLLEEMCQGCPQCCLAFFDYLQRTEEPLRYLLQKNPEQRVRQETSKLLLLALKTIKKHFPEQYGEVDEDDDNEIEFRGRPDDTVVVKMATLFNVLWDSFYNTLRSWNEYFGTMTDFAQLGKAESAALLDCDFLWRVILIIAADTSLELDAQFSRMLATIQRRLANRPPNYENVIALIDALMEWLDPELDFLDDNDDSRYDLALDAAPDEKLPYHVREVNLTHRQYEQEGLSTNIFVDKLLMVNQNHVATDSILLHLLKFPLMDEKIWTTLKIIHGDITNWPMEPYLRAAALYVSHSNKAERVRGLIEHVSGKCESIQSHDGSAFFEFHKEIFAASRQSEENFFKVELESLENIHKWAPGLLAYHERPVSEQVTAFLKEVLFQFGATPAFEEDGGEQRSQVMVTAGKTLGFACLQHLKKNWIDPRMQAQKDIVEPLVRVINICSMYFGVREGMDEEEVETQYENLRRTILEPMRQLTVDEIEEDGSDWDNSMGSSDQADIGDIHDGDVQ